MLMRPQHFVALAVLPAFAGLAGCSGSGGDGVADTGLISLDSGTDALAHTDAGHKKDSGSSPDTGVDATMPGHDAGVDTGTLSHDSGHDATMPEQDSGHDAGPDSGHDGGVSHEDAGHDSGHDSGVDSGRDSGHDSGVDSGQIVTLTFGAETPVSTFAQRKALGFQYGYVDGVLGATFNAADGGYTFFGSGHTQTSTALCPGTPNTQGAYRFGNSPTSITTDFGCEAVLTEPTGGPPLTDGGVIGYFDRDYLGGGPVLRVTSADGTQHGILMTFHAEFHWGKVCSGGAPCFYGTLGMALSTNNGASFTSLGEIIQPYITRPAAVALGPSISIGAGPIVLGDESGEPLIPPRPTLRAPTSTSSSPTKIRT